MSYHILDERSVADYLRALPAVMDRFSKGAELDAKEVGDGNLNLVFIVSNRFSPAEKVVVKQAVPYLRIAGEGWPLSRHRMRFESQALLLHNRLVPGLAPAVFYVDDEMSVVVMEWLGRHEILRKRLIAREVFPHLGDHLSTFLAETLFRTSDCYLSAAEKKSLQSAYINTELCKITEDFVFTNPYMTSPENRWNHEIDAQAKDLRANKHLKLAILEMKELFMCNSQALVHGDLHTGSIMVNQEQTRVLDPEFAFLGPMGFDVGAVLANLATSYCSHFVHTADAGERNAYQEYLIRTMKGVWEGFAMKFEALWSTNNTGSLCPDPYWQFPSGSQAFAEFRFRYLRAVLRDTAGMGGCKMMRRVLGIAHVAEFESIADPVRRAQPERMALRVGSRWVQERESFKGVDDLIGVLLEETSSPTQG